MEQRIINCAGGHGISIYSGAVFDPSIAGMDTSRLLTIGNPVCDDAGSVIGCTCLIRN